MRARLRTVVLVVVGAVIFVIGAVCEELDRRRLG